MKAWKVILATLVIFIAGVVTGGMMVKYALTRGKPDKKINLISAGVPGNPWTLRNKELLRRMDRELNLTSEQRKHIELIIEASQERIKVLLRPVAPLLNREMQEVRSEIKKELTQEQRTKFEGFNVGKPHSGQRHGTNMPAIVPGTNLATTNATP